MKFKLALFFGLLFAFFSSCSSGREIKINGEALGVKSWVFSTQIIQTSYTIEVFIQGLGKKGFVVDTGSNISFLIHETRIPSKPIFKKSLGLNQFTLENVPFYQFQSGVSEEDPFGTFLIPVVDFLPEKEGWDGILGTDILSHYIVDFDFPKSITIYEPSLDEKRNQNYQWFPLEEKSGHYFLNISGKKFLLDSGAGISVLPDGIPYVETGESVLLSGLGKEKITLAKMKKTLNPFCITPSSICISEFRFVSEKVHSIRTLTGKKENTNDGILGQNWFESHSIRMDYGNRRLGISNNHVQRKDHRRNEWGSR